MFNTTSSDNQQSETPIACFYPALSSSYFILEKKKKITCVYIYIYMPMHDKFWKRTGKSAYKSHINTNKNNVHVVREMTYLKVWSECKCVLSARCCQ